MPTNQLGISELINKIKSDLADLSLHREPHLFYLEEISLEINFVVTGDINSGFNLGVVTLGSQVTEERVQKVTVKLQPLVSKEQLIKKLNAEPEHAERIVQASTDALIKGGRPT